MTKDKQPTVTDVRNEARAQASQVSKQVAHAITNLDRHVTSELALLREDLDAMATVLDSYMARDRLLRKIIIRITGIKTTAEVPADVRRLLVEAGMITDTKPKEEQHDEGD